MLVKSLDIQRRLVSPQARFYEACNQLLRPHAVVLVELWSDGHLQNEVISIIKIKSNGDNKKIHRYPGFISENLKRGVQMTHTRETMGRGGQHENTCGCI